MNVILLDDGKLIYKEGDLLYVSQNNVQKLPILNLDSISIESNVTLNTKVFSKLFEHNIDVYISNERLGFAGVCTINSKVNGINTVNQVNAYSNHKRMIIAKNILRSAFYNMRLVLKQHNLILEGTIFECDRIIKEEVKKCDSVGDLLLLEAKTRKIYYSFFNQIIHNKDFFIKGRNYHPPKDPLNAMISYFNALLYKELLKIIYRNHLNPSISYLHSSNTRNTSLEYDLSEIFKPIIVDRLIFSLINNNQITLNDFVFEDNYCKIKYKAKRLMILSFYKKLSKTFKFKDFHISNRKVMENGCLSLRQYINGNINKVNFYKGKW